MNERLLESLIEDVSQCIEDILQNGDADEGIPSFEPLDVGTFILNFDDLDLEEFS